MNPPRDCKPWLAALVVLVACGWAAGAIAEPPQQSGGMAPGNPGDVPLNYRRVYVPADRVDQWPRGDERYVPIAAAELQRLLKVVALKAGDGSPAAARLMSARYTAKLSGDALLVGQVRLQISHDATTPALVPLAPCGIALSDPRWLTGITSQPAVLGVDQDGVSKLVVSHAGQLACEWSLRGRRAPGGDVSFALLLPNVPSSRVTLDLPEALAPRVEFGVVSATTGAERGWRRWQIDLGGRTSTRLTLVAGGPAAAGEAPSVVRQSLSYRFSPRGLEVTARLVLDIHGPPLPRLRVDLDPSLRVMDARLGDTDVPWSPQPKQVDGAAGVVLEFPEPLSAAQRVVQIRAVAPLMLSERRRLPAILPQGVFWQEGTATLLLPRPLTLVDLQLTDCRQTKIEPLPGSDGGESLEFQFSAPEAAVEVLVERQEPPMHIAAGTSLELGPQQVLGVTRADCTVTEGERFELTATFSPRWRIDTVESDPPGAIEQWSVQAHSPRRFLKVRLSRAITPKRPLRLTVNGHLGDTSLTRPIPHAELRMLDAPNVVWDERLVGLRCRKPYRLRVVGDEDLARLDPAALTDVSRARLGDAAPELVYADGLGARRLQASLLQQAPGHAAEVYVTLRARDRQLDESYRIVCRPDAGGMDRLLVHASQARTQELIWSLEDAPGERLQTRRLTAAQQREAGYSGGEMWEVVLQRPRTQPLVILATRSLPFEGPVPAALVAVGDFSEQTGRLTVHSETGQPLALDNRQLKPIPTAAIEPDRYNTVRAAYRYDPARDVSSTGPAPLIVAPAPETVAARGALVWRAWFESRYDVDGRGLHAVNLYLENAGRRSLRVDLPPGSSVPQVLVDGQRVRPIAEESSTSIVIDLSPGQRFPLVRVEYSTRQAPLGNWRRLGAPLPKLDLPVHAWHGVVWTPPGYRVLADDTAGASLGGTAGAGSPLRWIERLFGPMARPSGRPPFNPVDANDWLELLGRQPSREAAQRRAEACLRQLGTTEAKRGEPLALERLLAPAAGASTATSAASQGGLFVDSGALQGGGISARTLVPDVTATDPVARGAARLLATNLTLLVCDDRLVLTSADEAAVEQGQITPLFGDAAGMVTDAALSVRMEQAGDERDGAIIPLRRWLSPLAEPRLPWVDAEVGGFRARERMGWTATRVDMLEPASPRLLVIRQSSWAAMGWSLLLLITAGLWSWYPRRPRAWGLLLCAAAIAALLLPPLVAPAATITLLGTCVAGLLVLLWPRRTASRGDGGDGGPTAAGPAAGSPSTTITQLLPKGLAEELVAAPVVSDDGGAGEGGSPLVVPSTVSRPNAIQEPEQSRSTLPGPLLWLLAFLALAPCAAIEAGDAAPLAPVYRVLIPVDKKKQPVGDTWYVPLAMFNELHQRAAAQNVERHGWLTTGATYRGRLTWNTAHTRLELTELKAVLDVEVFGRQTQLRFPLRNGAGRLLVPAVTLDGHSIEPLWDEQGSVLLVDVAEPGRYRLEISPRPVEQETEPTLGLELLSPALPTARLELAVPADAPPIDVASALGAVRADASTQSVTAQLGGPGRLAISWPQSTASGAPQLLDVDQLVWLKVQPGAVTVETRLRIKGSEGRLHRFQLQADPRLRLLPLSREAAAAMQVHVVAGDPQTIVIDLSRGVSDDQELTLSFLWTSTSGLGQLRPPLLTPVDARTYSGCLAVSVDEQLRFDVPPAASLESMTAAELASRWNVGAAVPELIYKLPRAQPAWSLATRPRTPRTKVRQTVALSFSPDNASVRLEADLETTAGHLFQHRIQLPEGFVARRVSLRQADTERAARWSQSGSVLTIFLNGPVAGSQRLSIRGDWPLTSSRVRLPNFQFEQGSVESYDLAIYRRAGVGVQVSDAEALRALSDPAAVLAHVGDPAPRRFGQFYGAYHVVGTPKSSVFRVRSEPPRGEATQVVALSRKDAAWEATLDYRLRVLSGTIDVIRFQVPASFRGPFTITPPCQAHLVVVPGSQQRQLVIHPPKPVRDMLRLSIASPLAIAVGDRVGVPAIAPLGVSSARYVVLPKQVEREQVHWELRGLDPEPLPPDPQSPPVSNLSVTTYRITGDRFQAVLASVARIEKSPQVYLADMHLASDAAGNCTTLASYDLEPGGLSHCRLSVPPGATLVAARVGGLPATVSTVDSRHWILSLVSDQLPQRIEVLMRYRPPATSGDSRRLPVPSLRSGDQEIAVQQTLWTVAAPAGRAVVSSQRGAERVAPLQQQRQRLDSVTRLMADVTSEESIEVLAPWYELWARRASDDRRQIAWLSTEEGSNREAIEKLLVDNQRQREQTARRLRTSDVLQVVSQEAPRADRAADLWQWGLGAQHPPLRLSQSGHPTLAVGRRVDLNADPMVRLLLAIAVAALGWLGLRSSWGTRLAQGAARWPKAAVLGAGLLAWLLLWPSVLGLLLAGLAAVAMLRSAVGRVSPKRSKPPAAAGG